MFDFDDIEADVASKGADAWREAGKATDALDEKIRANVASGGALIQEALAAAATNGIPGGASFAHRRPGSLPIGLSKKVIIRGAGEPQLEGRVGEVLGFDESGGRLYTVKVMNMQSGGYVPGAAVNAGAHMKKLPGDCLELHPDQVEKDRVAAEDGAIVLLGGDAAERAAREALYRLRLDPQQYFDKAVERVLSARHEFEVLGLDARWYGEEMGLIKRAYRKISVGIHPDKNAHPQAVDCFRKVYGAFETLMDKKQQWRILFVLGKLKEDEVDLFEIEAEEEERFEWWLDANVPEIERQAAEIEGGEFEEIGEKWISDGTGGNINDVKWMGMAESLRLHGQGEAIFIDCRERFEFELEHIEGAFNIPMREFVDFGLAGVAGEWVSAVIKRKGQPIVVYSEVATPFSRCRSMCRWLLRAGSKSLPAERLRRLRGGMFGWRHKKGKTLLSIKDLSPEEKAALYRSSARQIGALGLKVSPGFNLRVRVQHFVEQCDWARGSPAAMLNDSSGGVLALLTTEAQTAIVRELAARQGSALVFGAEVVQIGGRMLVSLGPGARLEKSDREFTFGFEAKSVSEEVREEEPGADAEA